jgi:hypothetical protein|tara:strand:- start:150 stop:593 length:444 start_codon:yes stop_codon:yes gene_type:complete
MILNEFENIVKTEIEELHKFFVGWFTGTFDAGSFDEGFLARFDPDFLFISPTGIILTLKELSSKIRNTYHTNENFRISIRKVKIQHVLNNEIIATYEEWQRNSITSIAPDNGRVTTVIFKKTEPLRWLHVHETLISEYVGKTKPFDY